MIALRVKSHGPALVSVEGITGPDEALEGEELEFRMRINRMAGGALGFTDDLRVDVEATYSLDPESRTLLSQVLYVPYGGADVVYRFKPDRADATDDELRTNEMRRTLSIAVSYREGRRTVRTSQTCSFVVYLNSERVSRRVPTSLGNILGMTPKNAR